MRDDVRFIVSGRELRKNRDIIAELDNRYRDYGGSARVASVYASTAQPSPLYGGRPWTPDTSLDDRQVAALYENGIGLDLALSNHFFTEAAYEQTRPLLKQHHREGNGVICVNDELARRVKQDFPLYRTRASMIKGITTLEDIGAALEIYDCVTLPMEANADPELLKAITPKDRVILFANAACAYYCRSRPCYLGVSQKMMGLPVTSACRKEGKGRPLVSSSATIGALYFIRNRLDVAVSYAHHNATDVDSAIAMMGNPDHALCSKPGRLHNQLRQRMLSWSGHVLSWVDSPLRVHVLRYEDMLAQALETFSGAARFAELDYDTDAIREAIEASSFDKLKSQEDEHGFQEKNPRAGSFFRKGAAGSWRETLTDAQRDRIIDDHESVMRRFGYLTDDREPVY